MAKKTKSWEHRLAQSSDKLAVDFVQSLSYDKRLYKYDIAGSIAHAQMLAGTGIITKKDAAAIKKGLKEIEKQIDAGKFKFDPVYEDIHMAIENALIKKIGDAGGKLHTGRSRNDQIATDIRLWAKDEIMILQKKLAALQKAFLKLAEKYASDIMPSYTHLQRAQPVSVGAYLLSFVEMFARDYCRLGNCSVMLDVSPLGSGAVAGSTLPLDRTATAKTLGFASITTNSIDAVSDRDFCAELIFDCSLIAAHLSKLAEDFIIFASSEFSFINIADKYCTSSSMMPQKRNPDNLELIRGKTASIYGSLVAMLTLLKAQPSTYNRDLQEDKLHLFNATDTTTASLDMASAIVANTKFNTKAIAASMDKGFLDATALAEYLVQKNVPFRQAHGIVGKIVAHCEKQNKKLSDLTVSEFKTFCVKITKDVYSCLGGAGIVKNYKTAGSAGFAQTKKQINLWKKKLARL